MISTKLIPSLSMTNKTTIGDIFRHIPLDVVIRSATEPDVNPKPYSTSQGASQDIRALKMTYIKNQEGLNDEDNFYGFYTQEGVQANWN